MSRKDLEELLATKRQEERLGMERNLGVLGTMGNIAPFIGLFGTVVGIIKAFRDLALSGSAGPTVVAKGIAEALVATAGGLAVAIPAVIIYNYFMRKTKVISSELEIFSARLVIMLEAK
jgi:biopolymer transport protein ExbB/TolQ